MFKNPLKYTQGGSTNNAVQQVTQIISDIAGISSDEVTAKLQQISQDEQAMQMLSQALQLINNGDEQGVQLIKQMFGSKLAKGGKIHDFICKHSKGGKTDCGCTDKKQDGGLIKAKNYYARHANAGIIRKLQNFLGAPRARLSILRLKIRKSKRQLSLLPARRLRMTPS